MYMWKKVHLDSYDWEQPDGKYLPKKISFDVTHEYANGKKKTQKIEMGQAYHSGYIALPIAYWRKANEIHRWILDHAKVDDDCRAVRLSGTQIKELISDCKAVLANHSKAKKLLPTQSGFFFGETEYDEYYFQDLQYTVNALGEVDDTDEFIYQASW